MSTNRIPREEKTFKEKWEHFWKYYKFHALIWAIGLILLGSAIIKEALAPKYLVSGMLLNADHKDAKNNALELANSFVQTYKLDTSKEDVVFDTDAVCEPDNEAKAKDTQNSMQSLLTGKEKKTLDFVVAPSDVMKDLVYGTVSSDSTLFSDLRLVLTQEQYTTYEPYILYVDLTVVEKLEKAYDEGKDTSSIPLPDMTNPKELDQPVPILIDVTHCEKLNKLYESPKSGLAFGIISETSNLENTLNLLDFLMAKEN